MFFTLHTLHTFFIGIFVSYILKCVLRFYTVTIKKNNCLATLRVRYAGGS